MPLLLVALLVLPALCFGGPTAAPTTVTPTVVPTTPRPTHGPLKLEVATATELNAASAGLGRGDTVVVGRNITLAATFFVAAGTTGVELRSSPGTQFALDGRGRVQLIFVAAGSELTLRNLTLVNGFARSGGAISCVDSHLRCYGCVFFRNVANMTVDDFTYSYRSLGGGAVWLFGGSGDFFDSSFDRNAVTNSAGPYIYSFGGAVYANDVTSLSFVDSTFTSNDCVSCGGGAVAVIGIAVQPSTLLHGVIFAYNLAESGGASYLFNVGAVSISHSSFVGNRAGSSDSYYSRGGAMFVYFNAFFDITSPRFGSMRVNIDNSVFVNNQALSEGGAVFAYGFPISADYNALDDKLSFQLLNTTFHGNSAGEGGGVYLANSELVEVYGNWTRNTAGTLNGGALSAVESSVHLKSSYFRANHAKAMGGAIYLSADLLEVSHTIADGSTFDENNASSFGGAVAAIMPPAGTLTMDQADFTFNMVGAGYAGGAVATFGGTLLVTDSHFSAHTNAKSNGGSIYSDGFQMSLIRTTFDYSSGLSGGAVYLAVTNKAIITDCEFTMCSANNGHGGSIFVYRGAVQLSRNTFSLVYAFGGNGGSIFIAYSSTSKNEMNVDRCVFAQSFSAIGGSGGSIYASAGSILMITGSSFERSFAFSAKLDTVGGEGGAVYADSSVVTIERTSFFITNGDMRGGALRSVGGALSVLDSTFNYSFVGQRVKPSVYATLTLTGPSFVDNWAGAVLYVLTPDQFDGSLPFDDLYLNYTGPFLAMYEVAGHRGNTSTSAELFISFSRADSESFVLLVTAPRFFPSASVFSWSLRYTDEGREWSVDAVVDGLLAQAYFIRPFAATEDRSGTRGGGAVHVSAGAAVRVNGCSFQNNFVESADGGGSFFVTSASVLPEDRTTLAVTDCTFSLLGAQSHGAAVNDRTLDTSVMSSPGALLFSDSGGVTVTNSFLMPDRSASGSALGSYVFQKGGTLACASSCGPGSYGLCDPHVAGTSAGVALVCATCTLGACAACPPGRFRADPGAVSLDECLACGAGEVATAKSQPSLSSLSSAVEEGATGCSVCPAGKFSVAPGSEACANCLAGTFSSAPRSSACDACPKPFSSLPGSASCNRCIAGLVFRDAAAPGDCVSCPPGSAWGLHDQPVLSTLALQPGYWRAIPTSLVLYKCPLGDASCGGGPVTANALCRPGYSGVLCASCVLGYSYNSDGSACISCAVKSVSSSTAAIAALCVVAASGIAGVLVYLKKKRDRAPDWLQQHRNRAEEVQAERAAGSDPTQKPQAKPSSETKKPMALIYIGLLNSFKTKLKTMWSMAQLMSASSINLNVKYPASLAAFLGGLRFVQVDVFGAFSFDCLLHTTTTFYNKLAVATLAPLALGGLLVACDRAAKASTRAFFAAFLVLTYLVFLDASAAIFQTFSCERFEDLGESYLRADYSLKCAGPAYAFWRAYALCGIAIFPLGIPLLYATLVYRLCHKLCPAYASLGGRYLFVKQREWAFDDKFDATEKGASRSLHSVAFLAMAYHDRCCWYEVFECARRLSLSSALLLLPDGYVRTLVAIFLCLGATRVSTYYQPFKSPADNHIFEVSQWTVLCVLLCALVISLTDDSTGEQAGGLGVVVVVVSGATIILTAFYLGKDVQDAYAVLKAPEDKAAAVGGNHAYNEHSEGDVEMLENPMQREKRGATITVREHTDF